MKLIDYLEKINDGPIYRTNPVLKRLAMRALCSVHTIVAIARENRFASRELAERISRATGGAVSPKELINHAPKKRGPKPRPIRPA